MKALFVSNTSLTIRNFRLGLMRSLKAKGFEVAFCCQDNGYAREVSDQGFAYLPLMVDRKGTNLIADLRLIISLFGIYRRERPDIILHYTIKPNIYGSIAAKFAGIPCFNNVTGLGYVFIKKSMLYRLVKIFYKISCRVARKTFFQNCDDLNLFLEEKLINKDKAVFINGSGVNLEHFNPASCEGIRKDENTFVFLYTGRFLWDKGLGELVQAAKLVKEKYKNARFWMVGIVDPGNPSGINESNLAQWQREGAITYWKEPKDVRMFICNADCVVLPSYREGLPRSLLEAMAMKKPIITTETAGCRQVIQDGVNGFSVAARDSEALFKAFCRMIELNPEQRMRMGLAGYGKVKEKFDERIVNADYLREIEQVISQPI